MAMGFAALSPLGTQQEESVLRINRAANAGQLRKRSRKKVRLVKIMIVLDVAGIELVGNEPPVQRRDRGARPKAPG